MTGSHQYNEFVIDGNWWASHLPEAIEAIVNAPHVHRAFVRTYFGPEALADTPAIQFNLQTWHDPFSYDDG